MPGGEAPRAIVLRATLMNGSGSTAWGCWALPLLSEDRRSPEAGAPHDALEVDAPPLSLDEVGRPIRNREARPPSLA
jgi:hypothetical protein